MTHPILPYMPTVFIPVSDLKQSIEWYCALLEIPAQAKQEGGNIYYFNLDGTDIILDNNMWGFPPMIMFDTNDIDAAHAYCIERQYPFMGAMERYTDVAFFNVGGNMICQAKRKPAAERPEPAHPLLERICRVVVHADVLQESERWYETFLQRTVEPDTWVEGLNGIRMDRGAQLLVDDNRLSQAEKVRYDRLQLELRVSPIAIIESPDVEAALSHVRAKGGFIKGAGIERRLGLDAFTFADPDGNGLMVCQSKAAR